MSLQTTKPTLIEWGMGVHLNHPITARRGIRNSRPARWGLRKPHPPSRGGTARERIRQVEELAPIASNGPRLGGSTHGYTSWVTPNADDVRYVRVPQPRPVGILLMPVETNTPHVGRLLTDKRRIPLRSPSVRTLHLFHHGIPKVLVNPRSKGITSVRSTTTH
jgi:hypothetical protein